MATAGQELRLVEVPARARLVLRATIEGPAPWFPSPHRALNQEQVRSPPTPDLPQQIRAERILQSTLRLEEMLRLGNSVLFRPPYLILPRQRVFSAEKTRWYEKSAPTAYVGAQEI